MVPRFCEQERIHGDLDEIGTISFPWISTAMGATLHDEAVMFEPAKKGTLAFRFVIIANIAVVNRLLDRQASVGSVSQLAQIERCLEHRQNGRASCRERGCQKE